MPSSTTTWQVHRNPGRQPRPDTRAQLRDDEAVATRRRLDPLERLVERWRRSYAVHISTAAGATERHNSSLIQQPFRINSIAIQTSAARTEDVRVNAYVANLNTTTADTEDRNRNGIIDTQTDGLLAAEMTPANLDFSSLVGTIYRAVPTSLILVVFNNTAAAITCTAIFNLTLLSPWEPRDDERE